MARSATSAGGRKSGYFQVSSTFTYSAIFVLPLLLIYEVLITLINQTMPVLNGADAIIQHLLYSYGDISFYGFTALMIAALVAQLYRERKKYHLEIRKSYFALMTLESVAYAFLLGTVTSTLTRALLPGLSIVNLAEIPLQAGGGLQRLGIGTQLVLSVGAGIYEEFVFRVLLVSGLFFLFNQLRPGWGKGVQYGIAAVIAALIFSGFHYIGAMGDPFEVTSFTFRFVAGLVLNGLYVTRGYGIAVWTHALYDVIVTLAAG